MEMQQIRYFLSLCDELNFTRAAERCNVSQPSLTRAIKMLEEELGGALFHRERANTHLSELGRLIKPHLEQIFSGAEGAKQHAQDFIRLKKTPLRLGLMCTIAPTLLLDLIGTIRMRHPEIELRIVDAAAPKLHEGLIAGDLEVAIYAMPMVPPDERLHYLPLYREQFVIAMHAQHRLVANNAVRVKDFDGECYLSRVNCEYDEPATRIFNTQRVRCPTVYETDRDDWILAMAAAGLGVAFMPELCVNHPGVVARPIVEPEFWREVALVTVRGRPHSPAVGALVREAMQKQWLGGPALAVAAARAMAPAI
jgi:LysR family hydrogen peroxide-inducible transcriptional activator